ncbi:MAG: DNA polymerase I, partial [Deltaproteobacteria bacterium]|jgi:DNA polymerase-1|nr:DNA polymerase I [Deltaproteobacteria bacterium]
MRAVMEAGLKSNHLLPLLRDLEMPLIPVLLDMQDIGLGIDKAAFARFLAQTEEELKSLTAEIHQAVGREFNIRSAQQLGKLLFEELGLPKARKTSGGQASTSQEALENLDGKHPVVGKILEFRKLEKLRSTYLEPLPRIADATGRLHTSFNQSSTATGRLSSSNPNLQNIPVRGPLGSRMRACFVAAPGQVLVSADYSQIELRVLAHLSQDPTLLDAFSKNEDIHRRTAALLFDVAPAAVTPDQRRGAKTINFGLIYGMGPQKLARELGIGMNEAKGFIERYFSKLGKLREYFDQVEKEARERGFVCTMTGRRRPCPEILSANQQLRSRARRQAINTCIQGSAADIIKLAMLAVPGDAALRRLGARLILQIHDELLLECAPEQAEAAGKRLAEIMSSVKPGGRELSVPLSSDWGSGRSWSEAH